MLPEFGALLPLVAFLLYSQCSFLCLMCLIVVVFEVWLYVLIQAPVQNFGYIKSVQQFKYIKSVLHIGEYLADV